MVTRHHSGHVPDYWLKRLLRFQHQLVNCSEWWWNGFFSTYSLSVLVFSSCNYLHIDSILLQETTCQCNELEIYSNQFRLNFPIQLNPYKPKTELFERWGRVCYSGLGRSSSTICDSCLCFSIILFSYSLPILSFREGIIDFHQHCFRLCLWHLTKFAYQASERSTSGSTMDFSQRNRRLYWSLGLWWLSWWQLT